MTDLNDLKKQASEQTKFWIDLANDMYGINVDYPCISFKLKGRTAGTARSIGKLAEVRYNPVLLQENKNDFLKRTVPHEVAHIVVAEKYRYRAKPHGWEWKKVMRDFGLEPSRCHSYDTTNARVRTRGRMSREYEYKCSCRTYKLTVIRHRRVLKGVNYYCEKCKQPLVRA